MIWFIDFWGNLTSSDSLAITSSDAVAASVFSTSSVFSFDSFLF